MKKLQLLFIAFLLTSAVIAQVPGAINYQAVARNNAGAALASQTIKVRLTIVRNAVLLYSETRQVTTNALGLFNVQIGSSGALVTTGSFTGINWLSNPQPVMLKVELDINNTNVFTDMGTQPFATVPYSFATTNADNTAKIGGNAVATTAPATDDLLKWNGTAWAPATPAAAPVVIPVAQTFANIAAGGGGGAPWAFASIISDIQTITVADGQSIAASFSFNVKPNSGSTPILISADICYQQVVGGVPTGLIYAFGFNSYPNHEVDIVTQGNSYKNHSASGAVKVVTGTTIPATNQIPPGTYKVFLGIKNKSVSVTLAGEFVNGFIQVL